MSNTPPPDHDPRLRHLGGWRYRLAMALHYPCYFALVGAQVVRRRFGRGE